MVDTICRTHSHIIHMPFAHADSLQSEAVKKELFQENVNDNCLDLIDHLGKSSSKHGDLYRLKAGINTFKQLMAGEPGSRAQDLQKKIELLPPFPTSIDSSEPDGVESLKRKQKEWAKTASELSEALQGEIRKDESYQAEKL